MSFVDDFKQKKKNKENQSQFIFETILERAKLTDNDLNNINITGATNIASYRYDRINDILCARDTLHQELNDARDNLVTDAEKNEISVDVSVTGKVTEMLCKIGLDAAAPGRYDVLPERWNWIGDFAILGTPFNLFISVKSYKAKERLIVSGTGQNAAPVIGWGLFDDPSEWSPERVKQYKQRGFVAIYMPKSTYTSLSEMNANAPNLTPYYRRKYQAANGYPATTITNIYDRPLLRDLDNFATDISRICLPNSKTLDLSKL